MKLADVLVFDNADHAELVIADFGCCLRRKLAEEDPALPMTPTYRSPEVWMGDAAAINAGVWSAAAIVAEALSWSMRGESWRTSPIFMAGPLGLNP